MTKAYAIQRDFKNTSNRDCSWDYMNGLVEHFDGYYYEEGNEEEALLIDIHIKGTELGSKLIYMHHVFTEIPDILDFLLAVYKMEYCQKHNFNGVIIMKSRKAMDWFIAGRLNCIIDTQKQLEEILPCLEEALDWMDTYGCNYALAIDLESEYGVFNPRTGRGSRVSKLDVGFVIKKG